MKVVKSYSCVNFESKEIFDLPALKEKEPKLFEELLTDYPIKNARKKVVIETDKMIDLVALKEKEPELFEELVADYPCEKATYVFEVIQS